MKQILRLALILGISVLAACRAPTPAPTPTPAATTAAPAQTTPTLTPLAPQGAGCEINLLAAAQAYERPSLEAAPFAELAAGQILAAQARTADGWLGFDPGLDQPNNTGVFRLRWVLSDPAVTAARNCGRLPLLVGPTAGMCYTMPLSAAPVFAEPSTGAPTLAVMNAGDYALVTGAQLGWAAVDLRQGNTGLNVTGWMKDSDINLNGPCELGR